MFGITLLPLYHFKKRTQSGMVPLCLQNRQWHNTIWVTIVPIAILLGKKLLQLIVKELILINRLSAIHWSKCIVLLKNHPKPSFFNLCSLCSFVSAHVLLPAYVAQQMFGITFMVSSHLTDVTLFQNNVIPLFINRITHTNTTYRSVGEKW